MEVLRKSALYIVERNSGSATFLQSPFCVLLCFEVSFFMLCVFCDVEQYGGYLIVPGHRLEIGGGRLIYFSCLLENQTHGGEVKVT